MVHLLKITLLYFMSKTFCSSSTYTNPWLQLTVEGCLRKVTQLFVRTYKHDISLN